MTATLLAELVHATACDVLRSRGLDQDALPARTALRRPRHWRHGDYAADTALRAAGRAGVERLELAGWLAHALAATEPIASTEVAAPGFVNIRLTAAARSAVIGEVLSAGARYGLDSDTTDSAPAGDTAGDGAGVDARYGDARYAHARLAMVLRHAADLAIVPDPSRAGELLTHPAEMALIRALGDFADGRPVARSLHQLTTAYDAFDLACRVLPIGDEPTAALHTARVALCAAARRVLANGLDRLGVDAPERL